MNIDQSIAPQHAGDNLNGGDQGSFAGHRALIDDAQMQADAKGGKRANRAARLFTADQSAQFHDGLIMLAGFALGHKAQSPGAHGRGRGLLLDRRIQIKETATTRSTLASTQGSFSPKAMLATAPAVYGPTPGRARISSRADGKIPLCFSMICLAAASTCRARE